MPFETLRFADFELDRPAYQLRLNGQVVHLERIPLEVLFLLAERPGQLVTRQEILDRVWGKDVFVDADNSINTAIRKIRLALKENPERRRFLHTVAAKGYRFELPTSPSAAEQQSRASEPVSASPASDAPEASRLPAPSVKPIAAPKTEPPPVWRRRKRIWRFFLSLIALLLAASATRWYLVSRPKPDPARVMLAVLPFANLSGDPTQDYFVDGMTEEMITQLGSLDPPHLGVIARTSAMQYKNARLDAGQIGRQLRVTYLLEGSIRRDGERVRVTAQLIQTSDQTHLWAGSYDRDLGDLLKLQSEVAQAIAGKIELALSQQTEARLSGARRVNRDAYLAYLQGLEDWNLRTKDSLTRSVADFGHATLLDPGDALPYVGLARAYALMPVVGAAPSSEAMPKARDAALRAISLDDHLAGGHAILAFVKAHFEYDWPAAEREYRHALELNPSDASSHFFYSNSYLSPFGRHDAAIAEMKKAVDLDPFSPPVQSFLGRTYLWARRYDDALAQLQKSTEMFPNFPLNHERLSHLYHHTGNFDAAISEESKARLLSGEDPKYVSQIESSLRQALSAHGPRGYWQKLLEYSQPQSTPLALQDPPGAINSQQARNPPVSANPPEAPNPPEAYDTPFGRAIIYASLGDKENALASLQDAFAHRQLAMTELAIEPAFDSLRPDPRFQSLLHQVRLVP